MSAFGVAAACPPAALPGCVSGYLGLVKLPFGEIGTTGNRFRWGRRK